MRTLTRAGSFVPDKDGNLVNTAGFTLMGYEYKAGADPTVVVNGFDGLTESGSMIIVWLLPAWSAPRFSGQIG
ncbi:hypothetical protein ASD03_32390 [Ensifer sp. Root127]|nr:hypothetical protein ASD03_32390 [Ensifer sp. Root127]